MAYARIPVPDCPSCRRRLFLQSGVSLAAAGATALALPGLAAADAVPVPIPELDKNGHHNQPPMPGAEPSEIYNFQGQVATCHVAGTGKDGQGNAVPFGSPGTDFRFMRGTYVTADGASHYGTFAHI